MVSKHDANAKRRIIPIMMKGMSLLRNRFIVTLKLVPDGFFCFVMVWVIAQRDIRSCALLLSL